MWWGMHGNLEAMRGVVGLGEKKTAEVVPKTDSDRASPHQHKVLSSRRDREEELGKCRGRGLGRKWLAVS